MPMGACFEFPPEVIPDDQTSMASAGTERSSFGNVPDMTTDGAGAMTGDPSDSGMMNMAAAGSTVEMQAVAGGGEGTGGPLAGVDGPMSSGAMTVNPDDESGRCSEATATEDGCTIAR